MLTDSYHQDLMDEIDKIKASRKYRDFIKLLQKKSYNEALLLGFENCHPEDKILTELLSVLIRHKESLSLNLDISSKKPPYKSLIMNAVLRQNFNLYFLLEKNGATISKQIAGLHKSQLEQAYFKIRSNMDKAYLDEESSCQLLFNRLPQKSQFNNDNDNVQFDNQRIDCIIQLIRHLVSYPLELNDTSLVTGSINHYEKEVLYNHRISRARNELTQISTLIANLSGSMRKEYKTFLEPLSWITLEQIGAFTRNKTNSDIIFALPADTKSFETIQCSKRFFHEYSDQEELVEAAIPFIIKELPVLERFFIAIKQAKGFSSGASMPLERIKIPVIKALTRYFTESKHLVELLNLVNYTDREYVFSTNDWSNMAYMAISEGVAEETYYQRRADLSTKAGQHAILQRLKRIGEALTGKKSDFSSFDESIDCRALIEVRDGICHQDERNNKYIIDSLLNEKNKLEKMASQEIHDLRGRIINFIQKREAIYGPYKYSPEVHLEHVLRAELSRSNNVTAKGKEKEQSPPVTPTRRVSIEEEGQFVMALKEACDSGLIIIDEPEQLKQRCCDIFSGTKPTPNKNELGEILEPFSALKKTIKADLYKVLSKILNASAAKPRTSLEERLRKRAQQEEEANQHRIEQERTYSGLETVRELAKKFQETPVQAHLLNPVKRIDAALDALMNMMDFLKESGYFVSNLPCKTMHSWDEYHEQSWGMNLIQLLMSNHQLNDALEYNAGQMLQHLDTIRNFDEAKFSIPLNDGYEVLRTLRNYIEHGDPLTDNQDFDLNRNSPYSGRRQKIIAPQIIKLIFELLPDLLQLKEIYEKKKVAEVDLEKQQVEKESSVLKAQGFFASGSSNHSDDNQSNEHCFCNNGSQ